MDSSLDADTAAQSLDDLQNHDLFTYWHGNEADPPTSQGSAPRASAFLRERVQQHPFAMAGYHGHPLRRDHQSFGAPGQKTYQCGILINGDKKAFVIQCANPEDFSRLVSAFHYWAKSAALGGIPYQAQGLLLAKTGRAGSRQLGKRRHLRAGQAGLKVGDTLWGLDQADRRISGDELRERLENLPPGKHGLYVKSEGPNGKTGTKKLELAVP